MKTSGMVRNRWAPGKSSPAVGLCLFQGPLRGTDDEKSGNTFVSRKTTRSGRSQVDLGTIPVSGGSAFIATNVAMRGTDMESSRLRYDDRPSERFRAVDRKTQQGRQVVGLASTGLV